MAWALSTDPECRRRLDWIDECVRERVDPLALAFRSRMFCACTHPVHREVIPKLQQEVKNRDLGACHLGPDLGGKGYGQLKLALMNEILGRSQFAPMVFGCQAPDSGNAEILAHYGTE